MSNRRQFLKFSLGIGAALGVAPVLARVAPAAGERRLALYNTHTGESLKATYWAEGEYQASEIAALDRLLRDHRSGDVAAMDRRLFDLLHDLQRVTGRSGAFQIISGYRSPATNARLRRDGRGVAENSLHTRAQAIDIRLGGLDLTDLHRAALSLRRGGVGLYPRSNFIHVDTGRVRAW
jgi:uncharacterized protein YcbK (DUF882 family)